MLGRPASLLWHGIPHSPRDTLHPVLLPSVSGRLRTHPLAATCVSIKCYVNSASQGPRHQRVRVSERMIQIQDLSARVAETEIAASRPLRASPRNARRSVVSFLFRVARAKTSRVPRLGPRLDDRNISAAPTRRDGRARSSTTRHAAAAAGEGLSAAKTPAPRPRALPSARRGADDRQSSSSDAPDPAEPFHERGPRGNRLGPSLGRYSAQLV